MITPSMLKDCISTDNDTVEMTSYPYWQIVSGKANQNCCSGIWFSRESAAGYLSHNAYNFPKDAQVYCRSGNESADWRALIDAARKAEATQ